MALSVSVALHFPLGRDYRRAHRLERYTVGEHHSFYSMQVLFTATMCDESAPEA